MSDNSIPSVPVAFQFDDPKQAQIHQNLELFGQGPAKMFRDACAIISGRFNLLAATHIVGHLLREVLGAILDVLTPPEKEKEFAGDGANERKAIYALTMLRIAETDFVWQFWVENIIKGEYKLHRFAHRVRLFGPRRMDPEFVAFWNHFIDFLDKLLEATRGHLLEICGPLEELAKKPSPTKDDAKLIAEKLPHHPVYLKRFLDLADNPTWVELLDERGYFDAPPLAITVNGMLRAEAWPQDDFLLRMAPQTPAKVAEILHRIDWPWNPYLIFRTIIDAIKAVGITHGRPLVIKLLGWIDTHGLWVIDHYVGELAEDLGKSGAADLANQLTARLIKFDHSNDKNKKLLGPSPIIEEHVFRDVVLKRVTPSLKTRPVETIGLLCDALQEGLEIISADFKTHEFVLEMDTYDVLGDAEQITMYGVLTSISHAIRNHACEAISENFTSIREICDLLDEHGPKIFKRIKAYVVAVNATSAPSIVRLMLLNEDLFYSSWLVTEFNFLSEKGYRELIASERAKYLALLAKMPTYLAQLPDEDRSDAFERWQFARLRKLSDSLPPAWKEKLAMLNDKYASSVAALENVKRGRGFHGPSISHDSVAQMEMEQLVEFSKSWKPESVSRSNDLDLGYALSRRISSAPQKFVEHSRDLRQLSLDSVWWFFHGLSQALRENHPFDWALAISFAGEVYAEVVTHDVADRTAEMGSGGVKSNSDWTRRAVLQLINDGLRADEFSIPDDLLHESLTLLESAAVDPDPSASEDIDRSRPGQATQAAINCTRGIAFDALYHLVGRLQDDKPNDNVSWIKIRTIIGNYLSDEPSQRLAVQAMLGQLFPLLIQRDREWGLKIRDAIFPQTEGRRPFFTAAWEGYVSVWNPGAILFDDLRPAYSLVGDNLKSLFPTEREEPAYPVVRTLQHVIREFGLSDEDLSNDEPLLKKFVANASPQMRKTAIEIAGDCWSGADIGKSNGKQFAERMQQFYLWRSDQCKKLGNRQLAIEEVWAVGDWPREGFADAEWWLDQVINILSTWNATSKHSGFSDHLPECATSYPEKVLAIIEALVDANHPEWAMISMHSDIRDALSAVLTLDRNKYFDRIKRLVNRFSTRAVTGFDDLLQDSDERPGV